MLVRRAIFQIRTRLTDAGNAARQVEIGASQKLLIGGALSLLGGLLAKKRLLTGAAREYQQALKLQPSLSRLHLALANVLTAQGNMAGAVQHLRAAAKGTDPAVAEAATRELQQLGKR